MQHRDVLTGYRVALFIGQVLILIFCISYIEYVYVNNIWPDKNAKDTFENVPCRITNKRFISAGDIFPSYRADFLINYSVKNVSYSRWVTGNGLDESLSSDKNAQENIYSKYVINGTYECYYDPQDPQTSVLVLRHNWLSTFPLTIPSIIIVITVYYFLQSLFLIIMLFGTKNNEK